MKRFFLMPQRPRVPFLSASAPQREKRLRTYLGLPFPQNPCAPAPRATTAFDFPLPSPFLRASAGLIPDRQPPPTPTRQATTPWKNPAFKNLPRRLGEKPIDFLPPENMRDQIGFGLMRFSDVGGRTGAGRNLQCPVGEIGGNLRMFHVSSPSSSDIRSS